MLSCPICQDVIIHNPTDSNYPWALSCGHVFHKTCIIQSIRRNSFCPVCRGPVQAGFRLFLEERNREETITFLQDCVQTTEQHYARQKQLCQSKDSFIRELQKALEESEDRITRLRTLYVNYVERLTADNEKINDELQKLMAAKKKQYENFRIHLEFEKGRFAAMCRDKMESELNLEKQIQALKGEVSELKQQAQARDSARLSELDPGQLQTEINNRMSQVIRCQCQSIPVQSVFEVTELQEHLEQITEFFDLPFARKRTNIEANLGNMREESSVKQPRLEFGGDSPQDGDTDNEFIYRSVRASPSRGGRGCSTQGLGDAILDGPVIEIE